MDLIRILRNSKYKKSQLNWRVTCEDKIKLVFSDALVRKFPLNIITLVVWTGLFSMFIAMVATIWVFYSSVDGEWCGSKYVSCVVKNGSMYVPEECINQALGPSLIRGIRKYSLLL